MNKTKIEKDLRFYKFFSLYWFIGFIICIITSFIISHSVIDQIEIQNQTISDMNKIIKNQNTIIGYCQSEKSELESRDLITIAEQVANAKEYDRNSYNCFHLSQDLNRTYWDYGFEADVLGGYVNYTEDKYVLKQYNNTKGYEDEDRDLMNSGYGAHAWVKVCAYIEATTGEFIDKKQIIMEE